MGNAVGGAHSAPLLHGLGSAGLRQDDDGLPDFIEELLEEAPRPTPWIRDGLGQKYRRRGKLPRIAYSESRLVDWDEEPIARLDQQDLLRGFPVVVDQEEYGSQTRSRSLFLDHWLRLVQAACQGGTLRICSQMWEKCPCAIVCQGVPWHTLAHF